MRLAVILSFPLLSTCGLVRQSENYYVATIADLTLSATNHPHGWGKSNCLVCHNPSNLHQVNRLGAASFSLAQSLVTASGNAACSGCHGTNGVP
jgi:hypothetical protein